MIEFIFIAVGVGLAGLIVYRIFFVHETVAQVESDIMTGLKGAETKATALVEEGKEAAAILNTEVEKVKVTVKKVKDKAEAIEKVIKTKADKLEAAAVKKVKE